MLQLLNIGIRPLPAGFSSHPDRHRRGLLRPSKVQIEPQREPRCRGETVVRGDCVRAHYDEVGGGLASAFHDCAFCISAEYPRGGLDAGPAELLCRSLHGLIGALLQGLYEVGSSEAYNGSTTLSTSTAVLGGQGRAATALMAKSLSAEESTARRIFIPAPI